ncbi:MAG: hypothetical protein KC621_09075 [Myxococcales bacterium]|nr:hypothetical protein [Myxococcales bacterium]
MAALWMTSGAWACDPKKLGEIQTSIASAPNDDLRRKKLMSSLNDACTFPVPVAEALRAIPSVSLPDGFKLEVTAARKASSEWNAACTGGSMALERAIAARGPSRRDALWGPCDLQRYRFVDSNELASAQGYVFLSILVARHFDDQGVEDRVGVPLLRTLVGAGESAAPAPTSSGYWAAARDSASAAANLPWNGLTQVKAAELLDLCRQASSRPPAERIANKKVEFDVCAQAGRAIDGAALQTAPYSLSLQGQTVNAGYYAAALLANGDDLLIATCADEEIRGAVQWLVTQIRKGFLPAVP